MTDTDSNRSDATSTATFDVDRETFHVLAGDRDDRPTVVRVAATLDLETSPLTAYAALTGRTETTDGDRTPYAFESAQKRPPRVTPTARFVRPRWVPSATHATPTSATTRTPS